VSLASHGENQGSSPLGPPGANAGSDILSLFRLKVPLAEKWDTECSRFEFLHRAIGKTLALSGARVTLDLFKALMTRYRCDFVLAPASASTAASFAQTMGRAMRKIGVPAPMLELFAEPVRSVLRHQKKSCGPTAQLHARDQLWMGGGVDIDWVAVLVFGFAELNTSIADVLRAKARSIFAAAASIEQ